MKILVNTIVFIFFTGLGIISGLYGLHNLKNFRTDRQIMTKLPDFMPGPPSAAFNAEVKSVTGDVGIKTRWASVSSELKPEYKVNQSETIITQNGGNVTVEVPQAGNIIISQLSELVFSNLTKQMLLWQKNGSVSYRFNTGQHPVGVRITGGLITINGGSAEIKINGNQAIINSLTENGVKFSYVDIQNHTRTINLEKQVLKFNPESVTISQ